MEADDEGDKIAEEGEEERKIGGRHAKNGRKGCRWEGR